MHNVLGVHGFQTLENAFESEFDLFWSEFVFGFNFIVELSTLKQFDRKVDWVLALVDFVEFHQIFMIELPHNFYLI